MNSAISTILDLFYNVYEINSPDSDVNAILKSVCLRYSPLESLFDTLAAVQESLMDSFAVVIEKVRMSENLSRFSRASN